MALYPRYLARRVRRRYRVWQRRDWYYRRMRRRIRKSIMRWRQEPGLRPPVPAPDRPIRPPTVGVVRVLDMDTLVMQKGREAYALEKMVGPYYLGLRGFAEPAEKRKFLETLFPKETVEKFFKPSSPEIIEEKKPEAPKVVKTIEEAKEEGDRIAGKYMGVTVALLLAAIAAEAGGLTQLESPIWAAMQYLESVGLEDALRRLCTYELMFGLEKWLERYWSKQYRPTLPTDQDLREFWRREVIDEEQIKEYFAQKGLKDDDIDSLIKIAEELPTITQLYEMYWRGFIPLTHVHSKLEELGFRYPWTSYLIRLVWRIPPITDLIRFLVREVITPEDFYGLAKKLGLKREFARMYWDAHWVLPALGTLIDAYHRGIITLDELKAYMRWHDFSPTARPGITKSDIDIVEGTIYMLPRLVDIRRMRELGVLDRDGVERELRRRGYHPDDARVIADYIEGWVVRKDRDLAKSEILRAYILGLIDRDPCKDMLEGLGYSPDEAEFLVSLEEAKQGIERPVKLKPERDLTKSDILRAYREKVIDRNTAKEMLIDIQYDADEADFLLFIEDYRAAEELRRLKARVILRRYRYGYIERKDALPELLNLDYPLDAAEAMLDLEEIHARAEPRLLSRGDIVRLFIMGMIGYEEMKDRLKGLGYTEEDIKHILALDTRTETPATTIRAWIYGIIDTETVYTRLRRLGFSGMAILIMLRVAARRYRRKREA